ncbi:MAG: hypothetical protein NWQ28_04515 [Nodularia sp. (in: cyanobacteria)]|nr:hypothetical protein [Nodularia sp. (in: cyanobacteria)]
MVQFFKSLELWEFGRYFSTIGCYPIADHWLALAALSGFHCLCFVTAFGLLML